MTGVREMCEMCDVRDTIEWTKTREAWETRDVHGKTRDVCGKHATYAGNAQRMWQCGERGMCVTMWEKWEPFERERELGNDTCWQDLGVVQAKRIEARHRRPHIRLTLSVILNLDRIPRPVLYHHLECHQHIHLPSHTLILHLLIKPGQHQMVEVCCQPSHLHPQLPPFLCQEVHLIDDLLLIIDQHHDVPPGVRKVLLNPLHLVLLIPQPMEDVSKVLPKHIEPFIADVHVHYHVIHPRRQTLNCNLRCPIVPDELFVQISHHVHDSYPDCRRVFHPWEVFNPGAFVVPQLVQTLTKKASWVRVQVQLAQLPTSNMAHRQNKIGPMKIFKGLFRIRLIQMSLKLVDRRVDVLQVPTLLRRLSVRIDRWED